MWSRNASGLWVALVLLVAPTVHGASVVDRPIEATGDHLRFVINPEAGGVLDRFGFVGKDHSLAAGGGLLQEGFGVGSFYVPNRRINEQLEVLDDLGDRVLFKFDYDCDGPNIAGLHSTRIVEPIPHESSIRVTWKVDNRGGETHWVAPWVRNHVAPGGSMDDADRIDMPTPRGIEQPKRTGYAVAVRNWIAVTDPVAKETVYGVFHADQLHSLEAIYDEDLGVIGFGAAFLPILLEPGQSWETTYRINAVRGLTHVDFATDELAAQVDFGNDQLKVLFSSARSFENMGFYATILAGDGEMWRLEPKGFSISPDHLVRCTYDWSPPLRGAFDLLGEVRREQVAVGLGRDTGSPHGGLDTRFEAGGESSRAWQTWTDTPHGLDRGPRTLKRTLVTAGDTAVWIESPLTKIFREDVAEAVGPADPTVRIQLAKNERESFQLVIRPQPGRDLNNVRLLVHDLSQKDGEGVLPASDIKVARVDYVPVSVPSHFETPTGLYPDPLLPFESFTARGGECSPIWVTIKTDSSTPAGTYSGIFELVSSNADAIELWVEATVWDFELPAAPKLKTDFGFERDDAYRWAQDHGFAGSRNSLFAAYQANALEHRVTLRPLGQFPPEAPNYPSVLEAYAQRLPELLNAGTTSIAVPPSLLEIPELLRIANQFVIDHGLQDRVFCPFAIEPVQASWPRLLERMEAWREAAPDIPLTITTMGHTPLLADAARIWTIHSRVFDTPNNKTVLSEIEAGREVWWYLHHAPPRPYANFFLDFSAVEHRIVFWQAWALGVRGLHYWSVNNFPAGENPYQGLLDQTPVNGDGFLVYPGAAGPVDSIRWETIRDGIDDYDYLSLLMTRIRAAQTRGGLDGVLEFAAQAADLKAVIPDLVSFTREAQVIEAKRAAIAQAVVELGRALGE